MNIIDAKNKIVISCIIAILFLINGCTDVLDSTSTPLDEISTEDYWRTTNDLRLFVNQFYPAAFPVSGSDRFEFIFSADVSTDDIVDVQYSERLRGTRTVPASGGLNYSNIRGVNYFLENYEEHIEDEFVEYQRYVGEVHFFRAWFYFELVKAYGDVPWIDKVLAPDSEELYMARTPRNEVVDNIIADLDQAIELLPSGIQDSRTRLSREIAQAFKSRVALYEGTWQKYHNGTVFGVENPEPEKYLTIAANAALDVMNSGIYEIHSTGSPQEDYFFFGEVDYTGNNEVLFWKKYDFDLGLGNARQFQIGVGRSGGSGLTKSLIESYLTTDGRPIYLSDGSRNPLYKGDDHLDAVVDNRDPRLSQTIFLPGDPIQIQGTDTTRFFVRPVVDEAAHTKNTTGYQLKKTLNHDPWHHRTGDTQGVGEVGWILMRYAEVLLNYAEAKAELGTITQNDIDITVNQLRDRVGMPHLIISDIETDPNWEFPELSPLKNEIRRERRVELVAEGFRWNDIARWAAADQLIVGVRPLGAKFNEINYPDLNPNEFRLTEDGYFDEYRDIMPNGYGFDIQRDYLSPISTEELNLNPNLEQNPGWN
jgi:starch-binding outer membrane protein, SusD/RagB family